MTKRASVLVAGIGNVFLGDDAFGVEVVRRLAARPVPSGTLVKDFGIRGFDLAYALDSADNIILVDAVCRGHAPGTLYTIEPDLNDLKDAAEAPDGHSLDPAQVLKLAKQLNIVPGRILIVGCEPETFGAENQGRMGLSAPVEASINNAVQLVESFIARFTIENQKRKEPHYGHAHVSQ